MCPLRFHKNYFVFEKEIKLRIFLFKLNLFESFKKDLLTLQIFIEFCIYKRAQRV